MVFKADNFIAEAKSCGLKQCYAHAPLGRNNIGFKNYKKEV